MHGSNLKGARVTGNPLKEKWGTEEQGRDSEVRIYKETKVWSLVTRAIPLLSSVYS